MYINIHLYTSILYVYIYIYIYIYIYTLCTDVDLVTQCWLFASKCIKASLQDFTLNSVFRFPCLLQHMFE